MGWGEAKEPAECPDVMGSRDPIHREVARLHPYDPSYVSPLHHRYKRFEDLRAPLDGQAVRLARIEAKLDALIEQLTPRMAHERWNLP